MRLMNFLQKKRDRIAPSPGTGTMECLPSEIVVDLLSRLQVKSVLDCKLVCKKLQNSSFINGINLLRCTIDVNCHNLLLVLVMLLLLSFEKSEKDKTAESRGGPRFYYGDKYNSEMNIHENFYHKTLQKTSVCIPPTADLDGIVGSCNGLICLNRYHHGIPDPIHLCNPNTGEYVNLPEYTLREEGYAAAYGFGYVHSLTNAQYKVVRIYYPDDYDKGEVQVYTIGSASGWSTICETSYLLFMSFPLGIFVNGALHWIDDQNKKIVAFNLADEEFRLIQPPPCYEATDYCFNILQALRGNLCVCHQRNEENLLDIWTLKQNATEASWSRDSSIAYDSVKDTDRDEFPVIPILITKKNEFIFVHQGSKLYCCDPKSTTVINLWDDEKWKSMGLMTFLELWDDDKWDLTGLTAFPHMNSFVSLKALGERSESKKKLGERTENP